MEWIARIIGKNQQDHRMSGVDSLYANILPRTCPHQNTRALPRTSKAGTFPCFPHDTTHLLTRDHGPEGMAAAPFHSDRTSSYGRRLSEYRIPHTRMLPAKKNTWHHPTLCDHHGAVDRPAQTAITSPILSWQDTRQPLQAGDATILTLVSRARRCPSLYLRQVHPDLTFYFGPSN